MELFEHFSKIVKNWGLLAIASDVHLFILFHLKYFISIL